MNASIRERLGGMRVICQSGLESAILEECKQGIQKGDNLMQILP